MTSAVLSNRGVIKVAGADAAAFLQGLVTNDVLKLQKGEGRFAALLSPQGKILFDFLITPAGDELGTGFFLDCPRALAPDLARRLAMYRLRAKVAVEDKTDSIAVVAAWGEWSAGRLPDSITGEAFADPRHPRLGLRILCVESEAARVSEALHHTGAESYEAHRIALAVPRGGVDFAYGDAFPHEANMDLLHGIDFRKGCYVGQEVVSRVEHRGTARKRVAPVQFDGARPVEGVDVMAGDLVVGTMGSSIPGAGLAMLRLDKVEDARANGVPLVAGGVQIVADLSGPAKA